MRNNQKPTALKILEGNPGKRPLPKNEPKPAPVVKVPAPPDWLNKEAKELWKDLAPKLERIGLLTEVDLATFATGCQAWGKHVEMERYLKKHGETYFYTNKAGEENEVKRPQVLIGKEAFDRFYKIMGEFGLSPGSRTRIEVKSTEDGMDPMEKILSGVK